MFNTSDIPTVANGDVYGPDNDKIGSVGQVYLDNETGNPEWVTVKTGMFGGKESFVPLSEATVSGEDLHVPYAKDKVKDAPKVDADGELSPTEEEELYRYYGVDGGGQDSGSDQRETSGETTRETPVAPAAAGVVAPAAAGGDDDRVDETRDRDVREGDVREGDVREGDVRERDVRDEVTDTEGHDTSGPNTDEAMTRSEEQLNVGTRTEETGRARLRKYVVTEQQSVTVPVSHEEVRVEREPITDANRGDAEHGADISDEEHEVTLHSERPVVDTETVAVERVKLGTETVRDEETVTGDVRKEQVEVDGDGHTGGTEGTERTDRTDRTDR